MNAYERLNLIIKILATGIYRPWFWKHYKSHRQQLILRREWFDVASSLSCDEIKDGLSRWSARYGASMPPKAADFSEFMRPKMSDVGVLQLQKIREIVSNVER